MAIRYIFYGPVDIPCLLIRMPKEKPLPGCRLAAPGAEPGPEAIPG